MHVETERAFVEGIVVGLCVAVRQSRGTSEERANWHGFLDSLQAILAQDVTAYNNRYMDLLTALLDYTPAREALSMSIPAAASHRAPRLDNVKIMTPPDLLLNMLVYATNETAAHESADDSDREQTLPHSTSTADKNPR